MLGGIYRQIGKRQGERLFASLRDGREPIQTPARTLATVTAMILATPVHLATLVLLAAGLWLLIAHWFHWIPALLGSALIGAAYALRPRYGNPPAAHPLARNDAPALYGLADEIARRMGTEPVDEILVDGRLNAAYGQYGPRRRRYLVLGAPLWLSYDGSGKTALLAHEIAHQVNGDVTRTFWVGTAIESLARWYGFLRSSHPGEDDPIAYDNPDYGYGDNLAAYYFCVVVSVPVYLLLSALLHLSWQTAQRAEYRADYLGSRVSGTAAYIAADEQLAVLIENSDALRTATKRHAYAPEKILPEFVARFKSIPPGEMERVRRIGRIELSTLDASHPPTHSRRLMVEAFPCEPELTVSEERSDLMNMEVAVFNEVLGKELIDRYLSELR